MGVPPHAPDPYRIGTVVGMLIDDSTQDYRSGDRGTILLRDALGDLHIDFERGGSGCGRSHRRRPNSA